VNDEVGRQMSSTEMSGGPQNLDEFETPHPWLEPQLGRIWWDVVHHVVDGGDRWCVFIRSRSPKNTSIHTRKTRAELRQATHLDFSNIESVPKSEVVLLASAWFILAFVGIIGASSYLCPLCETFYKVIRFSDMDRGSNASSLSYIRTARGLRK